ncbi:nucleotide exchange factor GrpE [Enterobacteriaceae endosymbiont of Donacia cinerea]|uniref:nucleotide exchange factor GrpE n=1 Tax=Enterobacteriaceae endosymbiont of Donacia cinerea TaxID=2675774 RepID=UPI001448B428|nr:nucleotide exchange factor GrpE [Enterobacteriaceae endosymbiont of Donacia cinerea]QJC34264.1 nucleotide exchange factor GrpE [Enterobacteriaceae endosymbiont of Donacia cinerea]
MKNNKSSNNIKKNNIEKKEESKKLNFINIDNNIKKQNYKHENENENKNENENTKEYNIEYFKKQNDSYKLEIIELKNKLIKYENNIWDIKLRSQSEIENVRRRASLDIENAYKFSLEKFIKELLPVIDNLERAINLKTKQKNNIDQSIIEGIKLTLKSLLVLIKKFGISIINKINIPFDPTKHQAMSIIESDTIKENYILEILQKGYFLNMRLLRPAMVIVSKNKKINNN